MRQFKLDFLPIAKERYMLACRHDSLRQSPILEMIRLLKGPEFERLMGPVPGYTLDNPGGIIEIKEIFP